MLIRPNLVKGVVALDLPNAPHPYGPATDVAIRVTTIGATDRKQYCARFGGPAAIKDNTSAYLRRDAPAPTACSPSGAYLEELPW